MRQNDCQYPRLLRSLQTVDRFVADLTDYLASEGELSNTYVVYYTDNGNHWGEHRLSYGKLTPYETDTGFPLLIRGPDIPRGTTSARLVGNHDINANLDIYLDQRVDENTNPENGPIHASGWVVGASSPLGGTAGAVDAYAYCADLPSARTP